ncbi:hypothetical protein ACFSM5_19280 [Lacibacterium aquatile]|uniref:Uncharacterized protein n=1 Tax=Lacibacterium aquatile TaxID=1168082 RepID=A0ABW5E056_9PROT
MANDRIFGAGSWRRARDIARHPRFHEGFLEAFGGQSLDYAKLDRMPPFDQCRYENGREVATECRCAGLCIDWRHRNSLPGALKTYLIGRIAARKAGRASDPYRAKPQCVRDERWDKPISS